MDGFSLKYLEHDITSYLYQQGHILYYYSSDLQTVLYYSPVFWTCDLNGHMEPVLGSPCHFFITTLIFSIISQQELHVYFTLNPMKEHAFLSVGFLELEYGNHCYVYFPRCYVDI